MVEYYFTVLNILSVLTMVEYYFTVLNILSVLTMVEYYFTVMFLIYFTVLNNGRILLYCS